MEVAVTSVKRQLLPFCPMSFLDFARNDNAGKVRSVPEGSGLPASPFSFLPTKFSLAMLKTPVYRGHRLEIFLARIGIVEIFKNLDV